MTNHTEVTLTIDTSHLKTALREAQRVTKLTPRQRMQRRFIPALTRFEEEMDRVQKILNLRADR